MRHIIQKLCLPLPIRGPLDLFGGTGSEFTQKFDQIRLGLNIKLFFPIKIRLMSDHNEPFGAPKAGQDAFYCLGTGTTQTQIYGPDLTAIIGLIYVAIREYT